LTLCLSLLPLLLLPLLRPLLLLLAATCMNATSSRSHCIVTVTVEKNCPDGSVLVGKLKLVDLAGR
jgi:hypothetical protein